MSQSSHTDMTTTIPAVGDSISPLTITDLTVEGGAIARHHGQVVFLDKGAPGAIVAARVDKRNKKVINATVSEILQPSPHDITPWCPVFGVCGGCSWQHIAMEAQRAWKEKRIADTLTRLGGVTVPVESLVMGADRDFRTRMTYAFGSHAGKNIIGLRQKNSQEVVPVTLCGLQTSAAPVLQAVQAFLDEHPEMPVWAYKDGYWRFLTVHTPSMPNPETHAPQIVVEFIVGKAPKKLHATLFAFIEELLTHGCISGALVSEKSTSDSVAFGDRVLLKAGQTELVERYMSGEAFAFSAQSFMQTNTEIFSQLLETAYAILPQSVLTSIWDLYCGSGVIGQYFAQKNVSASPSRLFGVDNDPRAIEYANQNALRLTESRATYRAGKIEEIIEKAPFSPTLVILDPPRSGASENVLSCIQKSTATHILYISCDVATQARDIKRLGTTWEASVAMPFDMFPNTPHIENVILLSRTTKGDE